MGCCTYFYITHRTYTCLPPSLDAGSMNTRTTSQVLLYSRTQHTSRMPSINMTWVKFTLFHIVNALKKSLLHFLMLFSYGLININCSKGKSAHTNGNDLSQHQFLKGPMTHKCRNLFFFFFCANENTNTHTHGVADTKDVS